MTPNEVAAGYDQLADQWLDVSTYGFAQVERAVGFVKHRGVALDVGCGTGRLMGLLGKHGFAVDASRPSVRKPCLLNNPINRPVPQPTSSATPLFLTKARARSICANP